MRKSGATLGALLALVLATSASAGGRARVQVSEVPKQVITGQSFEVVITVHPESWTHRRNVEPIVTAECRGRKITTTAVAQKRDNQYRASLKLPAAGRWTVKVNSNYCETVMEPVAIQAVAAKGGRVAKTGS